MKLILINGPKGAGKDTLAEMILSRLPDTQYASFKTCLYEQTARRLGVDLEWLIQVSTDRATKEQPYPELGNISPRAALIDTSENHIKKELGEHGVSYHLVHDILSREHCGHLTFVIPDSGFNHEVNYLKNILKHYNLQQTTVVRIDRPDCTFENDSREYIRDPDIKLTNTGTPEDLYNAFITQYQ